MKKNNKIRSKVVKESLLDYNNLAETLKENTTSAVRDLLDEAVRNTYAKLINEADDEEDYDVEEVDDTDSETPDEDDAVDTETSDDTTDDGMDSDLDDDAEDYEDEDSLDEDDDESFDDDFEDDDESFDEDDDESFDDNDDDDEFSSEEGFDDEGNLTGETTSSGSDEDGDWSEFEKYKVSDDEYDLSEADDDEIVRVYKLLKDDDQVVVQKDSNGRVNIKDNETGAEYLIDLDGDDLSEPVDDFGGEDDFENLEDEDMNESRIYEIALNEYNSNVGYTDNYQSKDVMTNPGMSEPSKSGRDWDRGVPKGDSKPWSGYPGKKNKADKPFNAGKGKTVEEEDFGPDMPSEGAVTEGASMGGRRGAFGGGRSTGTKYHRTNSSGNKHPYGQHHISTAGDYEEYEYGTNESMLRKANKIFNENKQLKSALGKFKNVLEEAAVTNVNLGQIIKLLNENSTSQDEKKEIIARFGKEAKTVAESKRLYESISRELKKKGKMNLDESRQYNVEGSKKINETQIYKSQDLMESLDLMHRIC